MRRADLAVVLLLFSTAPALRGQDTTRVLRQPTPAEDLQMFSQVLNQIRVNHPDSIDSHVLFLSAIEGMLRAADPHSYIIPASRIAPEKEEAFRKRKLYPVPLTFSFIGGSAVVVGVAAGSAASRLDILPGDQLIAIDDKPLTAESELELELFLAGNRNTSVALTLLRRRADGSQIELRREVLRERVEDSSVLVAGFMLDSITGYVRVTTFMGDKIADELKQRLDSLSGKGMQQLLLDLRDNGGGSVKEASDVAGALLPAGSVIYTAEGRKPEVAHVEKVQRAFWSAEKRYPIVVLINKGTASASELVAGALQDHDRALVVGHPSFGKALIMQTLPLSDGSLLALVVGHIKTPCGRIVQRQYRHVRVADYYRLSGEQRAVAGRQTCTSDHGRLLYGGGGIYPDVVLSDSDPLPSWLTRARELDLPLRWVGGYVTAHTADLASLDDLAARPRLPVAALEDFRAFAAAQGVQVPADANGAAILETALLRTIAFARWSEAGLYRIAAALDPEVSAARREFSQARAMLSPHD